MTNELRGVYAPIVTPFRASDGEVDHPWIARHLAYLRAHGCDGVVACGTNGEAASMSVAERRAVLETTLQASQGMVVIAGTGAAALPDAVELTRHAFASGVAGVLVMPPFYFKRPADQGVVSWYRELLDKAVPPGGRVLLYHIPQTTGVPITDTLLRELLASHRGMVYGIKDSTGDREQGSHLRATFPELVYFVGNDHLVAKSCLEGGAGSITAGANVFPDLVRRVQEAAWSGGDTLPAQETLSAARALLESVPLQPATKSALSLVGGLPPTTVRPPQIELTSVQYEELRAALQENLPNWRGAATDEPPGKESHERNSTFASA